VGREMTDEKGGECRRKKGEGKEGEGWEKVIIPLLVFPV